MDWLFHSGKLITMSKQKRKVEQMGFLIHRLKLKPKLRLIHLELLDLKARADSSAQSFISSLPLPTHTQQKLTYALKGFLL
jgi:5,10-methylene-tetrahydrofolate dehydrogenase/methenyl tetrahydrofolate cyclohydrolase